MASQPVLAVSNDADVQLRTLKGVDLISYFRSLSWSALINAFVEATDASILLNISKECDLVRAEQGFREHELPSLDDDVPAIREYLRDLYCRITPGVLNAGVIIADVQRIWEARVDDVIGRVAVGAALDPIFVKDHPHVASHGIAKHLDSLRIPFNPDNPERKFGNRLASKTAAQRLLTFWAESTSPSSILGFIGRFEGEADEDKIKAFRLHWTISLIQELDAAEARQLAAFLAQPGEALSPKATRCRAQLMSLLRPSRADLHSASVPPPTSQRLRLHLPPQDALRDDLEEPVVDAHPTLDRSGIGAGSFLIDMAGQDGQPDEPHCARPSPSVRRSPGQPVNARASAIGRIEQPRNLQSARVPQPAHLSGTEDSSSDDEMDSAGEDLELPARMRVLSSAQRRAYLDASRSFRRTLRHGGPAFVAMYEPVRSQIATAAQLEALLEIFLEEERVTYQSCNSQGLPVSPNDCQEKLTSVKLHQLRPRNRRSGLAIRASDCVAPFEISHWLANGSLETYVKNLAARIGSPDKDNADGYLSRTVLVVGLALSSIEIHIHNRQNEERSLRNREYVFHGDWKQRTCTDTAPNETLKEFSNQGPSAVLPDRNWSCERTTETRLRHALGRLAAGPLDGPCKGVASFRDTPRGPVNESLKSAVKRFVALNASSATLDNNSVEFRHGDVGYWMDKKPCATAGRGTYCLLEEQLAAIPPPSTAATADLRDILLPEHHYMLTEKHLLLPKNQRPSHTSLARHSIHLGVKSGHYPALLRRMHASGMICFLPPTPNVIENSVFGVWKDTGQNQRLIWGGTRSNQIFNPDASYVELPTPDLLGDLCLPPNEELFLASCDISQFYNRLKAPDFLIPLLGLPRVRSELVAPLGVDASSTWLVPCLLCIPMGATFAVSLAQTAAMTLIKRAGAVGPALTRAGSHDLIANSTLNVVYIDDISTIGTRRAKVNQTSSQIVDTLEHHHLPEAKRKRQCASRHSPGTALGLWWWKDGILTVQPSMVATLRQNTTEVLDRGTASPHDMRVLLGKWTWACLLRRCLLSVLEESYTLCMLPRPFKRRPLRTLQRLELELLLDLLPLMYADLRAKNCDRVYASDACPTGGAVTYFDVPPAQHHVFRQALQETKVLKGLYYYLRLVLQNTCSHQIYRCTSTR